MTNNDNQNDKEDIVRLKLEFTRASGTAVTAYWALDADGWRRLQQWQALRGHMSADNLHYWLRDFAVGNLDRADGPALIETSPDASRYEAWYSNGEFVREQIRADLSTIPGVTILLPQP